VGKPKLKQGLKHVKLLSTWKLVLILVLMLFVTATLLRLNNVGMIKRRDAVIAADKAGNKQQLEDRLTDLRNYVFSTMNADASVSLQYQYERDAKAAIDQASKLANSNVNANRQAADVCDAQAKRYGWGYSAPYFNCFVRELENHPSNEGISLKAKLPNVALYKLSFASPLWTPSLAGLAVLICLLIMVVIVVRITIYLLLRLLLLRQPKD